MHHNLTIYTRNSKHAYAHPNAAHMLPSFPILDTIFVTACLTIVPAFSVSFFVSPLVTHLERGLGLPPCVAGVDAEAEREGFEARYQDVVCEALGNVSTSVEEGVGKM
jgi:hypothetical protein